MIYKFSFKKGLYHYWSILIYVVGPFLFVGFMVNRFGYEDLNIFILLASILSLIFIIPTLFLHIQYYVYSCQDRLEVTQDGFKYKHKNMKMSFKLKDIKQVASYKTKPLIEKRNPWLPWDSYNFTELILKDGQTIIITCYLVDQPEFDTSEGTEIHIKEVFFPDLGKRMIKTE